jgi:uncharacterized protein
MARSFLDIAGTPSVKAAQAANGVVMRSTTGEAHIEPSQFSAMEAQFIASCDSFYLASVSESGWPYVQHRGGPPGFLRVIDSSTLAFADFRGNRQYISLGNVTVNGRVALLLMNYAARRRLKIYARIEAKSLESGPRLAEILALPGYRAKPERLFLLHMVAFDWNCSQHITPRFTEQEIEAALAPVRAGMAQLEAENKMLRDKLGIRAGEGNV